MTNLPWIKIVSLNPPTLQDNTADADRLVQALKNQLQTNSVHVDLDLLKKLPNLLRKHEYNVRCILFCEHHHWLLIGISGISDTRPVAGLAIDLGTTRVVLRLMDLSDGRILAESGFDNPQLEEGPDILSRIHFAESTGGLERLQNLVTTELNRAIDALCKSCRFEPQDIYIATAAGNTAMTHFFIGLDPHWMIREPYIPVVNKPPILKAAEVGLHMNLLGRVFIFPNIGSYFGGDLIAGIFFSGLYRRSDTAVLIDVGTNAEVVVGNKNWLIACAGAAGPALEGGVTKIGMTAGAGAVDRITIDPKTYEFEFHTIGHKPPKGLCGSGVIDLAAQLFKCGMIDIRGKFISAVCGGRLKKIGGLLHLVIVPAERSASGSDLTISQADLDSLIRSKAAMYTILETITASVGITLNELNIFYIGGTFGSFINPRSAIDIGMLPDLSLESYQSLENSSIEGATLALTSVDSPAEIDRIRDRITYLELNVNQDFMNRFNAAKFLPHTDPRLFPSVKVKSYNPLSAYE